MSEKKKMEKFLKLYRARCEELRAETVPFYNSYTSREEFIEYYIGIYRNKRAKESKADQVFHFLEGGHFDDYYSLGLYEAFTKWDMRHLLNVLYQSSRWEVLCGAVKSFSADHTGHYISVVKALAANDAELVEALLPEELGLSRERHAFGKPIGNMFLSLWYKNDEWLKTTKPEAEKYLTVKSHSYKPEMEYYIALAERDMERASRCLKGVCVSVRRNQDSGVRDKPYLKCLCNYVHGLYNFAHYVLPEADFRRLQMPDDEGFIKEFAEWNIVNGFPKGELFLTFPEELDILNQIFNLPIPQTTLTKHEYNNTLQINRKRFYEELCAPISVSNIPKERDERFNDMINSDKKQFP
jgi:hypothetical protein